MRIKPLLALFFALAEPALADIEIFASVVSIAPDPFTNWFCGNYTTCIIGIYAFFLSILILVILALLLGVRITVERKKKPLAGEPGIFRVYYPYWLSADEQVLVGEVVDGVLKRKALFLDGKGKIGRVLRLAANKDGELWSVTEAIAGAYIEVTVNNKRKVKIEKGQTLSFAYSGEEEDKEDAEDTQKDGFSIAKGHERKDIPDKSSS